jgi:DNA mismatch endonuclease (patch repair protein)
MLLRSALHRRGVRFRVGRKLARRCRPDIIFPGARVAVFVDGCFWHGCPQHGKGAFAGPNALLWEAKLARNRRNDADADLEAKAAGYVPMRLWECVIVADPAKAADTVIKQVDLANAARSSARPSARPANPRR